LTSEDRKSAIPFGLGVLGTSNNGLRLIGHLFTTWVRARRAILKWMNGIVLSTIGKKLKRNAPYGLEIENRIVGPGLGSSSSSLGHSF
jgi:hypothetical protein